MDEKSLQSQMICDYKGDYTCHVEFFATKIVIIYFQISSSVPMPFGTSKGQKAFLFLSWLFFSLKTFNYIAKDASIFHLKLAVGLGLAISQVPPLHDPSPHQLVVEMEKN